MSGRGQLLIVVVTFALAGTAGLWALSATRPMLRAPGGQEVLADPDSYMRWRLVERALAGEGVRIRWVPDDNAPRGRLNEWMSPMTMIGVMAVKVMGPGAGQWLGPVMGLIILAALGWWGWRAGGWPVAVYWLVAWPALTAVRQVTQFGNTDHHSLHQLVFVCLAGGCLARPRESGVWVGLVTALGMWTAGSEMLPAWALVAGLAIREARSETGFWRAWWVSGLMGTTAAWLFEFWPHVFHGHLEFISAWHVGLWCVTGGLLEFLRSERQRSRQVIAVLAAVALALILAGATRGFDWGHLHVMQDAFMRRQFERTVEFGSPLKDGIGALWRGYGLLVPAWMVLALSQWKKADERERWLMLVAGTCCLLMMREGRWGSFFVVALVMNVGLLLPRRRPWLCAGLIVVATLPAWWQVAQSRRQAQQVAANPVRGPYGTTFVMEAVSGCLGGRPVVLATWDQGAVLAGMGKVRVIGSGYWSNAEGLRAAHEMFSTRSPERFWELVREREVEYFLVPPPELLAEAIQDSTVISGGRLPSLPEVKQTVAWQVASRGNFPVVACEPMARIAPQGSILDLRRKP